MEPCNNRVGPHISIYVACIGEFVFASLFSSMYSFSTAISSVAFGKSGGGLLGIQDANSGTATRRASWFDALERVAEGAERFARYSKCESSIEEENCECHGVSKNSNVKKYCHLRERWNVLHDELVCTCYFVRGACSASPCWLLMAMRQQKAFQKIPNSNPHTYK